MSETSGSSEYPTPIRNDDGSWNSTVAALRLSLTEGPDADLYEKRPLMRIMVESLVKRLEVVEDLHAPRSRDVDGHLLRWCRECGQNWPCPTVKAANGDA